MQQLKIWSAPGLATKSRSAEASSRDGSMDANPDCLFGFVGQPPGLIVARSHQIWKVRQHCQLPRCRAPGQEWRQHPHVPEPKECLQLSCNRSQLEPHQQRSSGRVPHRAEGQECSVKLTPRAPERPSDAIDEAHSTYRATWPAQIELDRPNQTLVDGLMSGPFRAQGLDAAAQTAAARSKGSCPTAVQLGNGHDKARRCLRDFSAPPRIASLACTFSLRLLAVSVEEKFEIETNQVDS